MSVVRAVIADALRALRASAVGEDPTADELAAGLEAVQSLILEIHEGKGPMATIDVSSDRVAGENQRLRIQEGVTAAITLPNAVRTDAGRSPHDYGFIGGGGGALPGSSSPADGAAWRAPLDGARVEIVGASQALYFYRDDLNAWQAASGLGLDSELPFSARLAGHFAALLAERLGDPLSGGGFPPLLARRIARARAALMLRSGRVHTNPMGRYL